MKKSKYSRAANEWLKNYFLCSNCDKKEDCIAADSFCRDVVLAVIAHIFKIIYKVYGEE